jgi:Zn finger protein HypA/HybF involved in hydrogenase expression
MPQPPPRDKKPLWAKCSNCGHTWAVAYLPMEMETVAQLLTQAKNCPRCGGDKPTITEAGVN